MAALIDTVAWVALREERILGTRSHGKTLFYIPGGKREPGEGDLDTLLREVKEELGVNLHASTAVHVGTFDAPADGYGSDAVVRMACYTADHDGNPTPQGEIAEMEWLAYTDRRRVAPVDRLLFDQLHEAGDLV